jgi:exportin-7
VLPNSHPFKHFVCTSLCAQEALDIALKLALTIPLPDILTYRKVGKAWFGLLDALCHAHASTLAARETTTVVFVLSTLEAGLKSLDVGVSSQCAAAIDNLAAYAFEHQPGSEKATSAGAAMAEHLRQHPELFPRLLSTLFEIVLFEDCSNQWSLSRPMLPLILTSEHLYAQLRSQIVSTQPADRQAALSACLDKLMDGVARNLSAANRDKFTAQLTMVRHEFRSKS